MSERFSRTEMLLGTEAMNKLANVHVAVFGVGGVGGYTAEALVRSGIGELTLVDSDTVAESNINRQIIATTKTIGRYKTEVMKERALEINPEIVVRERRCFFLPDNASEFDFTEYDYVVDAVDTVTAKLTIAEAANKAGVPIISCMGAGNKLNPGAFEITDLYKTSVCPLAKVMRRECKLRGIKKLKVLYSKEEAIKPFAKDTECDSEGTKVDIKQNGGRRTTPGSVAFVPSVAGLMIAGEVIRDLTDI
ncbi:MAG: tRNA threonylcarbamoyladenosine dehydratase [Lachnospiraceae bacterium]|nr:tRNA threonylcarbamoyladenosine dehydratase [Lachnospiraceae bacterium]